VPASAGRGAKSAEFGAKTAQIDPIFWGPCQEKRTANRANWRSKSAQPSRSCATQPRRRVIEQGHAIGGSGAPVHAPRATAMRSRTIEGGRRAQVLKTNKKGPPKRTGEPISATMARFYVWA
tara:strand:- start:192 stop:557 length:366 start_codon:yes stop_codon:yes gene_type:complete